MFNEPGRARALSLRKFVDSTFTFSLTRNTAQASDSGVEGMEVCIDSVTSAVNAEKGGIKLTNN